MSAVAQRMGLNVWEVDVSRVVPGGDERAAPPQINLSEIPPAAPLILHVNPPVLAWTLLHLPRRLVKGRRVIGYWAWELPRIPLSWALGLQFVHEVWAPSHFAAGAIARDFAGPVRNVPHPLAEMPPRPAQMDRAAFGIPGDSFVVLTSFDLNSSLIRKNPEGAIAAFRQAFGDRPNALLILKVMNHDRFPNDFAALRDRVAESSNIRLEVRAFPSQDNYALMAACDVVLSMHRSEGFGFVPAEAMLLGVPVVATNWSATAEFLDASCGMPVPYTLVPAHDPRGAYEMPHTCWAEPSVGAAADALLALAADNILRQNLGAAACKAAAARLGAARFARAVAEFGLIAEPQALLALAE
ncbi:MAG: glycosyltransferase family 1 protein [Rhodospirillales bacterium]|nr:glycosyltransferase family 1 protein [Rhodospirillales bacterium]